jgi:hypothetical protein
MLRRLSWIALPAAAVLAGTVALAGPAAAVGPFGPAETVIGGCSLAAGDAAIAVDGTTRGFANCTDADPGPVRFFRDTPTSAPVQELSPYTGVVVAAAWDGQNATYVVIAGGGALRIGKRLESTGSYSPLTTLTTVQNGAVGASADVVAANGQWWAVWTEPVGPGGEFAQTQLFQRHTLLGTQGRTRITTTAGNVDDFAPTLAFANNRVTLVWTRATSSAAGGPADLRIAESSGGAWLSRPLASLGDQNTDADVTVNAGVTWVTWTRDGQTVVADNAGGTFHSLTFGGFGSEPTVAVSGTHVFVAWRSDTANRAVIAERTVSGWTSGQVDVTPSFPLRVLAQAGLARVIYWRGAPTPALVIRTQHNV